MKTRIITAMVGLVVLAVVLSFFDTIVLNIAVAIISGLSVYELLKATNPNRDKIPEIVCIIIAILIPFFPMPIFKEFLPLCAYAMVFIQLLVLIKYHKTMKFEQMTAFLHQPGNLLRQKHVRCTGISFGLHYFVEGIAVSVFP